jgi:hypothetical protein
LKKDALKAISHIILIDDTDIYVFKPIGRTLHKIADQNIKSFLYFSDDVNYALCKDDSDEKDPAGSGLFYYNLNDIIANAASGEIKTLPFKIFEVGCNHTLFYSKEESRIGYFSSLSHATIIPLLHTNCIKFIGINKVSDYFAFKVIKDKFIALNKTGELQTWNLITGKYIRGFKLKGNWFKDYVNHDPESGDDPETVINRRDKVLIKSIEPIADTKLEDFYEGYQLHTNLDKQKTYI